MRNLKQVQCTGSDDHRCVSGWRTKCRERSLAGFAKVRLVAMIVILGACLFRVISPAVAQPAQGYDLKAALLFNLTRFVEWPDNAFPAADTPVVIGILGEDPFGRVLDEIVRNEKCGDRAIKIERYRNVESAQNCQILFVSASEQAEFPRIFRVLRARPIVTVGDSPDFDARGGMIRFFNGRPGKIRLGINHDAFKAAGLMVSAKLLRLAEAASAAGN